MIGLMPAVFYIFAVLTIAGGAMGTIVSKNHEPWSIIGSLAFGAISIAGGILMRRNQRLGLVVGLTGAVLFTAFFVFDFLKSGKPMPALGAMPMGIIVILLAILAIGKLPKSTD